MRNCVCLIVFILVLMFITTADGFRGLGSIPGEKSAAAAEAGLAVHFIDVGQGDSTLIVYNGKTMLIDGGPRDAGNKVVSYLKAVGVDHLDMLVATHSDADHVGGLVEVVDQIPVNHVLDSGKEHITETYADYLRMIDEKDICFEIVNRGHDIDFATDVDIQVRNGLSSSMERNDSSLVLKLSYGETDFMLMGDATKMNEVRIMDEGNVEAEIIKVGHHGSNTSSGRSFLDKVQPETAILSYGENDFGHPDARVVRRLRQAGAELYSTYQSGDIVVSVFQNGYTINAEPWEGEGVRHDEQNQAPGMLFRGA
ncbi:ComEC/Rec2 family competence protein [Bacillus piscicola]|uniref:ComEC/Rec2 family competence protein n=1 Tax=Bacillus piscicola TaxID=1632684 RepID=UPI001F08B210|nr:MBL fold metallo-hydrolase [Bacillus piscicola]